MTKDHYPSTKAMSLFNAMPVGVEVELAQVLPVLSAWDPSIDIEYLNIGAEFLVQNKMVDRYGNKLFRRTGERIARGTGKPFDRTLKLVKDK